MASGLLKGLSGLLPGLDAAKLLQQQQQNPSSDSQANSKFGRYGGVLSFGLSFELYFDLSLSFFLSFVRSVCLCLSVCLSRVDYHYHVMSVRLSIVPCYCSFKYSFYPAYFLLPPSLLSSVLTSFFLLLSQASLS